MPASATQYLLGEKVTVTWQSNGESEVGVVAGFDPKRNRMFILFPNGMAEATTDDTVVNGTVNVFGKNADASMAVSFAKPVKAAPATKAAPAAKANTTAKAPVKAAAKKAATKAAPEAAPVKKAAGRKLSRA